MFNLKVALVDAEFVLSRRHLVIAAANAQHRALAGNQKGR
jgi:hypothetical protein